MSINNPVINNRIKECLSVAENGLSAAEIFSKVTEIEENAKLFFILGHGIKLGFWYKSNNRYYIVKNPLEPETKSSSVSDAITEDIKKLLNSNPVAYKIDNSINPENSQPESVKQPKVVISETQRTVVKTIDEKTNNQTIKTKRKLKSPIFFDGKPLGQLRQTSLSGRMAYYIYAYKDAGGISRQALKSIFVDINNTVNNFNQAITFLVNKNYVKKEIKNKGNFTLLWGDKFHYPFTVISDNDKLILKQLSINNKETDINIPDVISDNNAVNSPDENKLDLSNTTENYSNILFESNDSNQYFIDKNKFNNLIVNSGLTSINKDVLISFINAKISDLNKELKMFLELKAIVNKS